MASKASAVVGDGAVAPEVVTPEVVLPKPTGPKTYRALEAGYLNDEGRYIMPGEIFTTANPKGSWMEDVD